MKQRLFTFFLITVMLAIVAGCTPGNAGQVNVSGVTIPLYAPGTNPSANTADAHDRISGLLPGIWHGIISPVTLVMSLINPDVQMYEVHNTGSPYNFGFLIGVAIVFILLGALLGSRRR
jgi:hypothetical protein